MLSLWLILYHKLLNHFLTIRTTCPSEALTVCIGLFEFISNWFVELELAMLGETGFDIPFSFDFAASELIRPVVKLLVSGPIAKLEAESFVRPLHLKYRRWTIFLVGSLQSITPADANSFCLRKRTGPDTLKGTFECRDYTNSNNQSF